LLARGRLVGMQKLGAVLSQLLHPSTRGSVVAFEAGFPTKTYG
jgi:hypothetical protein